MRRGRERLRRNSELRGKRQKGFEIDWMRIETRQMGSSARCYD